MTDRTINQLTTTTSAASADLLPIWVTGSGVTRAVTKANFMGGAMTGGGTVATGGFTLTVPATGTAALRGAANTFTNAQTINTTEATSFSIQYSAVDRVGFTHTATRNTIQMFGLDCGASFGPRLVIGRNTNASTPSSGYLRITNLGNTDYRIWVDASGNVRIHNDDPINAADTAGTVVGAQTSMAEAKHISDGLTPIADVLASIQEAAAQAVKRFTYRSGSFNRQEFEGVVVDDAPRYGMDRDAEHPAGKSLNEITLLGDLLRAVAWLAGRVEELERR